MLASDRGVMAVLFSLGCVFVSTATRIGVGVCVRWD